MALTTVQAQSYLQLVQSLFYEVGAAGFAPTTTVGQTGEARRLVNYVHDAELEIQNLWVDWKWLRKSLTAFTGLSGDQTGIYTTLGGGTSAFPLDLAEWDFKTFFIYPAGSTVPQPMPTFEWQEVRDEVFDVTDFTQPWRVIIMPDNTLRFDLIPDQSYKITCEYRTLPYDLKADVDVSNIPARFANRIIVEWARMKYGHFENAAEQVEAARWQIYGGMNDQGVFQTGLLPQLENDQLPNSKNARLQQGNNIVIGAGSGSDMSYGGGSDGSYGGDGYGYGRNW
jgi:hypothetical protein